MEQKSTLDGHDLRAMFTAGTEWLKRIVPDLNALNVYPVPDGDCGTNMLLTMRASLAETVHADGLISSVAEAIARGALMGARGNSGVILSQIWRGLARSLAGKRSINARELAQALTEASEMAYQALTNPVEGTILTVMKDAAAAARQEAGNADASPVSVLEAAVNAARESVANTPNRLDVLKEAGVVDAGGHGLYTLLEGALLYLKDDLNKHTPALIASPLPVKKTAQSPAEEEPYGFCTQFMVKGKDLPVSALREALDHLGKSLIVVGDSSAVRVHIHTLDPAGVTRAASSFGSLFDIDIRDMDEQHKEFLLMQKPRTASATAVVAVVNGDGLINVFSDLGVCAVVPGGQTMNPSTIDMLQAVEKAPSDNVILLPNNKNVIPAAMLVPSLTKKNLKVLPTETIPQGIAALIAFTPEADFQTNCQEMAKACAAVKTIEVTRATRNTKANRLKIKEGQMIGLLDGELLAVADTADDVIFQLLSKLNPAQPGVLTLYYGKDASQTEAEQIGDKIRQRYPELVIGVVSGGQPHYSYIISVE